MRRGESRVRVKVAVLSSLVLALGVTSFAATSASGSARAEARVDAGTAIVRLRQDWPNFDVHTQSPSLVPFLTAVYDRLIETGPKGIVGYVASKWVVTPTKAVFTIRKGVTCADGTPVTPEVVANSFKRLIDPTLVKTTNTLQQDFGPGPYATSFDNKAGTFTFRTATAYSGILLGFTDVVGSIVCPAGIPAKSIDTATAGSGAYTVASAQHGDSIVLKKRAAWKWAPTGINPAKQPDEIVYKLVTNETTAANLLLTGGLTVSEVTGPDITRLQADKSFTLTKVPIYFTQNVVFNTNAGRPANNEAFRKAVSMVVDPKAWNQASLIGLGTLSTSFILPGENCHEKKTAALYPKLSVDGAKKVLTDAGYRYNGNQLVDPSGRNVAVKLVTFAGMGTGGEYLQAQLRQLGITVDLQNLSTTYGTTMLSQNFDVAATTTSNTSRLPIVHMGFYFGKTLAQGGQNLFGFAGDLIFDRALRLAGSTSGAEQCKWYSAAQQRVLEKAYFLPMVAPTIYIFSKGWKFWPGPRLFDPVTLQSS